MMKSLLASFILFCYVFIGTFNSIGSVYKKPVTRIYVHSLTCQLKNYLALDCFDACNGTQQIQAFAQHAAQKDFIISTLSLDLHCMVSVLYNFKTEAVIERFITVMAGPPAIGINETVYSPPDSFSFS